MLFDESGRLTILRARFDEFTHQFCSCQSGGIAIAWSCEMNVYDDLMRRLTGVKTRATVRSPRRAPAQTGIMTPEKFDALVQAGYGQGHLESYQPWLRITKRDYSPNSNVGHLVAKEFGHTHHPRSRLQRALCHALAWLGAFDVRDQYPLWPFDHEHPIDGLMGVKRRQLVPGFVRIARDMGIDPGNYPASTLDYVHILHTLSTWIDEDWKVRLVAHQIDSTCKEDLDDIGRSFEINLVRHCYCQHADIPFRLVKTRKLPGELATVLDAIRPSIHREELSATCQSDAYKVLVDTCSHCAYRDSASSVLKTLSRRHGMDVAFWTKLLHIALWRQDLDHDLGQKLELYQPLIPGGIKLRAQLRLNLL